MAFSVNWIAKTFTIPQSDLTFVSGNNYTLSMVDVHSELSRLQWAFDEGLWAPPIMKWYETVTLSGIPKTPSVEVINSYTFDFTGSNYNVILTDYDNNLVDVYTPSNGISILGNNSVGRQTVVTGSGLSSGQDAKLTNVDSAVNANLKNIEGTDSHAMVMRVIRAALCGTAKDADTDGPITENTTRIAYMSSDGSKPRLIFDVVNLFGTRTGATLDMSP